MVVADASPLIALARIGRLEILRDVFGSVFLPDAVWRELVETGWNRADADFISQADWIQRRSIRDHSLASVLRVDRGAGEAEAIVLAREMEATVLLIDERLVRADARSLGLTVTGLDGVLIKARERELLPDVVAVVEALHRRAGFWLTDELRRLVTGK